MGRGVVAGKGGGGVVTPRRGRLQFMPGDGAKPMRGFGRDAGNGGGRVGGR